MRTIDVPKHIRDRVAAAHPRGAQVGNSAAGWRTLSEIRGLLASAFGTSPKPRRAQPQATTTSTTRARPDDAEALYRKAWPK